MIVLNDLLNYNNLKIYQDTEMFNFSLDSVLLSNFVKINKSTKKILDIGTGNAPIPMMLSTRTDAHIDGVEIQSESCELAIKSINYNNLQSKISIINSDIKIFYKSVESDVYDTIVCNPPFFKINNQSKLNNKKGKVIARHEKTLSLDDIMLISRKLLKNNGNIAIVHRPDRMIDIINIMQKYNIEPKKIQLVYPKTLKDANILLIEGVKNGKSGLKVLNPLVVHNQDGTYTEEIKCMFRD